MISACLVKADVKQQEISILQIFIRRILSKHEIKRKTGMYFFI